MPGTASAPVLVIDTNIVLDVLVFEDPASAHLRGAVLQRQVDWLVTARMRDELQRVLAYPQIARRMAARGLAAEAVLEPFDALSRCVPDAPRAAVRCRDPDDQIFVDLAVAHRAGLLSKDALVLRLGKRLAPLGVRVGRALESGPVRPS